MSIPAGIAFLAVMAFCSQTDDVSAKPAGNWHHWRGPNANGLVPDEKPPIEWSESKNVKWKVRIPGSGASTDP